MIGLQEYCILVDMDKIILIDDDDFVVRAISSMLESVEYEVESYPDAGPALEQGNFVAADLIITDLEMPTSGEDFIAAVRGRGIGLPILVVSGFLTEERREELVLMGVQAVLEKPFRMQELLDIVERLIEVAPPEIQSN